MQQPLPGLARRPDDVVPLTGPDVHCVFAHARCLGHVVAVGGDDGERTTVDVHRMDEPAARSDEAHEETLPELQVDGLGRGEGLAVDREVVRLHAIHRHGRERVTVLDEPFLELDDELLVERDLRRAWIDDKRAVEPRGPAAGRARGASGRRTSPPASPRTRTCTSRMVGSVPA